MDVLPKESDNSEQSNALEERSASFSFLPPIPAMQPSSVVRSTACFEDHNSTSTPIGHGHKLHSIWAGDRPNSASEPAYTAKVDKVSDIRHEFLPTSTIAIVEQQHNKDPGEVETPLSKDFNNRGPLKYL